MLDDSGRRLVEEFREVADAAAWRFWNRARLADLAEVKSAAYFGLVQAAERFPRYQAEHGYELQDHRYLVAFLKMRIDGAIIDWARTQDHVTRAQRQRLKQLEGCAAPGASAADLARAVGLTEEQVLDAQAAQAALPVSLDGSPAADVDEMAGWRGGLADPAADVESVATVNGILGAALRAVCALPFEQQLMLILRYFEGRSVSDAAEVLGFDRQHALRLHESAVIAVHEAMLAAAAG